MPQWVDEDCDDVVDVPLTRPNKTSAEEGEILLVKTDEEYIEVNNVRLFSLDEVALDKFTNCTSLSMRKNLIHDLTPLPECLYHNLLELDLFDNKVRLLASSFFLPFQRLTKLDLSYNQIKVIDGLDALGPTLKELFLVENRIKVVQGLGHLVNLRLLELGGNRIREIGNGLDALVDLEQLWLGKNKVASLGNSFHNLKKLKLLSLQANRLTEVSESAFPAGCNPSLQELYLSENGLTVIDHLQHLNNLHILDVSFNPITALNSNILSPENFPQLEEFWMSDGRLSDWKEVDKLRCFQETLGTVYLERNPIEQDKRYRDKVYMALPFLHQIDSWPVVNKGNVEADRAIHRR